MRTIKLRRKCPKCLALMNHVAEVFWGQEHCKVTCGECGHIWNGKAKHHERKDVSREAHILSVVCLAGEKGVDLTEFPDRSAARKLRDQGYVTLSRGAIMEPLHVEATPEGLKAFALSDREVNEGVEPTPTPKTMTCTKCGGTRRNGVTINGFCPTNGEDHDWQLPSSKRKVPLSQVEAATALVVDHKFPWCRAKILHALAGAEEQGKLQDVLEELLEDAGPWEPTSPVQVLRDALQKTGWIKK